MVLFQNLYYDTFVRLYKDKKIIAYGIGGTFSGFLKNQAGRIELLSQIEILIDGNESKTGTSVKIGQRQLHIQSLKDFESRKNMVEDYVMILFLADKYIEKALVCIDQVSAFDGMPCIFGLTSVGWGYERFMPPQGSDKALPRPNGCYEMPATIHYCWFGENKIPNRLLDCIKSWEECCPDYTLKLWNESNVDIASFPKYVKEAYDEGKYAFVSDYVRLIVVYENGGIYLDTDVLMLKNFNQLRKYRSFYAFMEYAEIATGLGFGSIARTKELKEMLDLYNKVSFWNSDGTMNLTPCPRYTNDYFERRGVAVNNSLQLHDDMLFLPSNYLAPLMAIQCDDGTLNLSLYSLDDNTMGIHLCENSWKSKTDIKTFDKKKQELSWLNNRLLRDWKRGQK